ncbi:hypothetical protein GW17_00002475, partial [Ensete ventricosum]
CPSPPSPSPRRRRCPCVGGGCPLLPPCQGAATIATGATAPAGSRAGRPLRAATPVGNRSLQVARPWLAAPTGGLAVASNLYIQTTCMWPPLPRRQRLLSLSIATTSA